MWLAMQPEKTDEAMLREVLSQLFVRSRVENVDDRLIAAENKTRELMARGELSAAFLRGAIHSFLYFGRTGISRAVLRNLERLEKTPMTEGIRQILHGPDDDRHKAVKALYLIKHANYDRAIPLKPPSAAGIAALPLASCTAVLDGACGTGLAGPVLRGAGFAGRLVGIDISEHMISQALAKGCYDQLGVSDIVDYLETCDDRFDAILLLGLAPHLDNTTLRRVVGLAHAALSDQGHLLLDAPIIPADSGGLGAQFGLHRSGTAQVEGMFEDIGFLATFVDDQADLLRHYSARRQAAPPR